MNDDDELIFAEEPEAQPVRGGADPWKILIIDDESEVHKVTKLALRNFTFDDRPLEFISAYSGREARSLLKTVSEIAVILLDVVMETENAGLDLVHFIRRDLGNRTCRIILRTGQPGQAPEREVIRDYDINDYKAKTELTSQKLFTLMHASLRSYRDIVTLERSKRGLEKVIKASKGVFEQRAYQAFVEGAMEQLLVLLQLDGTSLKGYDALALQHEGNRLRVVASTSGKELGVDTLKINQLPDKMRQVLVEAIETEGNVYHDPQLVLFCGNASLATLLFVEGVRSLSEMDRNLLDLFTENIMVALENIRLNEVLQDSKKELVYRLGGVIESRSEETGFHVKRVALYCELLAELAGLSAEQQDVVKQASPLHDIGKVGIPDHVLRKPGRLSDGEWMVMKEHARIGHDILSGSGNPLLDAGAVIAVTHHEHWDGSGYPEGLAGDHIPIFGRIAAIADVFDALCSNRCYKEAWSMDKVFEYLQEQRGKKFDPSLVDLVIANRREFIAIRKRYPDQPF